MKYLLDTNIIIYYLENDQAVYDFVWRHKKVSAISMIVYYEVLNYPFTQEQEKLVRAFLENFEIIGLSHEIINKALQNRKEKKIKMADNFILATAQVHGLQLATNNSKDFESFTDIVNPLSDDGKIEQIEVAKKPREGWDEKFREGN
jgi:predicted nucleic acid-binding protein